MPALINNSKEDRKEKKDGTAFIGISFGSLYSCISLMNKVLRIFSSFFFIFIFLPFGLVLIHLLLLCLIFFLFLVYVGYWLWGTYCKCGRRLPYTFLYVFYWIWGSKDWKISSLFFHFSFYFSHILFTLWNMKSDH